MKWLKRILGGLLGVFLLVVLVFAGVILFDAAFGPDTDEIANTTQGSSDGQDLIGYLAQPDGSGSHPAVLLIHECRGLNEGMTSLADALAAEGYIVLAPDAYRGQVTAQLPRALWLRLTTAEEQVFADVDAALAYPMSMDNVDTTQVASRVSVLAAAIRYS